MKHMTEQKQQERETQDTHANNNSHTTSPL